jgi:oxygen-independent coproporphyrinogen-3 oxidase
MTTLPIDLIRKYDRPGPRYTSYPTALSFHETFGPEAFEAKVRANNATGEKPLSLYFHLPFCKQVCYFCACNAIYTGKRERAHPYVDNLLKEIALVGELVHPEREVTQLHWGGGTPTFLHPELMVRLQETTKKAFRFAANAEISVEVDPREASDEHLQALAQAGFNRVSMGVQDFHPDVQVAVNRIQPYELTAEKVHRSRELGFGSVNLDLMYGLPRQTLDSMAETLAKTIGLRPDRIAFFNYAYLPELKKHMRRINPAELPSPADKLAMLQLAVNMLSDAGYRYIGMDHFVLPDDELSKALDEGTLHRNFQGYTTHAGAEMYGFGVTSISDLGDAYAQNVKTELQYTDRMAGKRFATAKGVLLTPDDILRRDVIMELICRFELDFAEVGRKHGIDAGVYFADTLQRLAPFVEDGLVTLDGRHLKVTAKGKFLIRNICMQFDAYVSGHQVSADKFSRTV